MAFAALATMLASPAIGEGFSAPRLIGVVIGPQTREVVLTDGKNGGRTTVARDGAAFGGYRVKIVDAETVLLVGPSGDLTLRFGAEADPLAKPAVSPQSEPPDADDSVARLSIGRDDCAGASLPPGVRFDAEARSRQLLGAAANLAGPWKAGTRQPAGASCFEPRSGAATRL